MTYFPPSAKHSNHMPQAMASQDSTRSWKPPNRTAPTLHQCRRAHHPLRGSCRQGCNGARQQEPEEASQAAPAAREEDAAVQHLASQLPTEVGKQHFNHVH